MFQRSSSRERQSGFSLIELLVTFISLVIILTVSTQLMFAMRRGLVRQQPEEMVILGTEGAILPQVVDNQDAQQPLPQPQTKPCASRIAVTWRGPD